MAIQDILNMLTAEVESQRAVRTAQGVSPQRKRKKKDWVRLASRPSPQKPRPKTKLIVPAPGKNCPDTFDVTYAVGSASWLEPSHLPTRAFRPNPQYPPDTQERDYQNDVREQRKVVLNAQKDCFEPALLLNTDPTGLGGPPVILEDGIVLSGNGRAMTLQLVWEEAKKQKQREKKRGTVRLDKASNKYILYAIKDNPLCLNAIDERKVQECFQEFDDPVIVRLFKQPKDRSLPELIRLFNQSLTQSMDPTTEMVAYGRQVTQRIVERLLAIKDDQTFLEFARADPFFLNIVQEEGLIPQTLMSKFVERDRVLGLDRLTREGATWIQRALLASAIPDSESINLLPVPLRDALTRAVPWMLQTATNPDQQQWNPLPHYPAAIRIYAAARAANKKSAAEFVDQLALFPLPASVPVNSATAVLATSLLQRPGSRQQPQGWRKYANTVAAATSVSLFGDEPIASFGGAFSFGSPELCGPRNISKNNLSDVR